jgi:hypothetical protein
MALVAVVGNPDQVIWRAVAATAQLR